MVDLAEDQPRSGVEADVEGRGVGPAHLDAAQRDVRAVVGNLDVARVEEQRQVDTGQDQDDEAVEGDFPDHERPVVGEHLVEVAAQRGLGPETLVDSPVELADRARPLDQGGWRGCGHGRSQKAGPTGSV